jgi:hypothetical protein
MSETPSLPPTVKTEIKDETATVPPSSNPDALTHTTQSVGKMDSITSPSSVGGLLAEKCECGHRRHIGQCAVVVRSPRSMEQCPCITAPVGGFPALDAAKLAALILENLPRAWDEDDQPLPVNIEEANQLRALAAALPSLLEASREAKRDAWTPTSAAINALPEPLRQFVHDLETHCDPAGMVAENTIARDTIRALELELLGATRERDTLKAELGVLTGQQVSTCPCCDGPGTLVTDDAHEVTWGGARGGDDVGITVAVQSEWTRCDKCGEEWYTYDQSLRENRQVRIGVERHLRATVARLTAENAQLQAERSELSADLGRYMMALNEPRDNLREANAQIARLVHEKQQLLDARSSTLNAVEALHAKLDDYYTNKMHVHPVGIAGLLEKSDAIRCILRGSE